MGAERSKHEGSRDEKRSGGGEAVLCENTTFHMNVQS